MLIGDILGKVSKILIEKETITKDQWTAICSTYITVDDRKVTQYWKLLINLKVFKHTGAQYYQVDFDKAIELININKPKDESKTEDAAEASP